MFWRVASVVLALQAGVSTAVVNNNCEGDDRTKIEDGLADAIKMANTAIETLRTKMADDVFGAPFMQLFPEDTMEQVISTYTKVTSIPPALVVDLYCDEEHIEWRGDLNSWVDTKYTYTEDGITESLVYNMHVGGAGTKPGMQDGGSSYTTLGYKAELRPGELADCSDQAHVVISRQRLEPPEGRTDTRRIDSIVNDGLDERFNSLDSIHPLSATILHELIHVVGGLSDPLKLSSAAAITDGPGNAVYGLGGSFQANVNAQQLPGSAGTVSFADPYVVLAKEYYLQLKKNAYGQDHTGPLLWVLGAVKPDTLEPILATVQ